MTLYFLYVALLTTYTKNTLRKPGCNQRGHGSLRACFNVLNNSSVGVRLAHSSLPAYTCSSPCPNICSTAHEKCPLSSPFVTSLEDGGRRGGFRQNGYRFWIHLFSFTSWATLSVLFKTVQHFTFSSVLNPSKIRFKLPQSIFMK